LRNQPMTAEQWRGYPPVRYTCPSDKGHRAPRHWPAHILVHTCRDCGGNILRTDFV
jgi:hypothetical protein